MFLQTSQVQNRLQEAKGIYSSHLVWHLQILACQLEDVEHDPLRFGYAGETDLSRTDRENTVWAIIVLCYGLLKNYDEVISVSLLVWRC